MADHTPVKDPSKWGVLLLGIVLLVAAVLVLVLGLKNTVVNNSTDGERDVATLQTNNALAKEEQQKQQTAMVKSLITPIGTVKSAAPGAEGAEAAPRSGEEVYTKVCSACHSATGLPTAPKINDKAAWETRVAKNGFKGLLEASIAGTSGGMPARAGQNINDEELTSAIAYMTKEAGLTLDIPVAAPAEEAKTEEAAPAEE
ncbi:MAG: c-type cytochrome, partial [Thiotrichaceae bacterium]|nr:c-type cytochrome [Thiotrichaceae bacterium]